LILVIFEINYENQKRIQGMGSGGSTLSYKETIEGRINFKLGGIKFKSSECLKVKVNIGKSISYYVKHSKRVHYWMNEEGTTLYVMNIREDRSYELLMYIKKEYVNTFTWGGESVNMYRVGSMYMLEINSKDYTHYMMDVEREGREMLEASIYRLSPIYICGMSLVDIDYVSNWLQLHSEVGNPIKRGYYKSFEDYYRRNLSSYGRFEFRLRSAGRCKLEDETIILKDIRRLEKGVSLRYKLNRGIGIEVRFNGRSASFDEMECKNKRVIEEGYEIRDKRNWDELL